jgi:hypothetical protein
MMAGSPCKGLEGREKAVEAHRRPAARKRLLENMMEEKGGKSFTVNSIFRKCPQGNFTGFALEGIKKSFLPCRGWARKAAGLMPGHGFFGNPAMPTGCVISG